MQYNLVSKNTREIRKRRTFKPVFVIAAHPKGLNDYTRLESLLPPSLLLLLHEVLAVASLVVTRGYQKYIWPTRGVVYAFVW